MATEETTITELELAEEVLADMVIPVDTSTDTKSVSLKQLRAWLGSSLPTGFILPAVGKIDDERFTLLDGKTLSKQGTYSAFCTKVEEQVQANNWFACTEEEYNADLLAYGQCGKFVIGTDYVRIPKITRFIGATITLSEIGKTYKESLPNIKGLMTLAGTLPVASVTETSSATGAFYGNGTDTTQKKDNSAFGAGAGKFGFNASRSSSTYQDNAKVQPDHTKYPYYMVISTEGQTSQIEVDINKVYEDLELKANVSLSNINASAKMVISNLSMPSTKRTALTAGATGASYTAPANGYYTARYSSKGGVICFENTSTGICNGNDTGASLPHGAYIPAKKGEVVKLHYNNGAPDNFLFIYDEGVK